MSNFTILNNNRRNASRDAKSFRVVSVNANGALSKAVVSDLNCCATQEQADARMDCMERNNPGRKFVVVVTR